MERDEIAFRREREVIREAGQRGNRMAPSHGKLWLLHAMQHNRAERKRIHEEEITKIN